MEVSTETLKTIIDLAYKENSPRKLNHIVSLIYAKADFSSGSLSKNDMEKLNKISLKAEDFQTYFSVGLIYNYILAYHLINIDSFDADFVLLITNVLYPIYEKVQGTILSRRILIHLKKLFYNITQRSDIPIEDRAEIANLLKNPVIKMDNVFTDFDDLSIVKDSRNLLKSKKDSQRVLGILNLLNIITDSSCLEEQLKVFHKKVLPILKAGNMNVGGHPKDLLNLLAHLVNRMFFQYQFYVEINHNILDPLKDPRTEPLLFLNFETQTVFLNSKDKILEGGAGTPGINTKRDSSVISYRLSEQEAILKLRENMHPVPFFINTFMLYPHDIEIQRLSIDLLQRLYYLFPKDRKNIEEAIMSILAFINQDPLDSNKKEASAFLYKLIHRDATPEFKQNLLNRESFKTLFQTPYYNANVLTKSENTTEAVPPNKLLVESGFPKLINIKSGESFTTFIEVWKPYSIISWVFTTPDYDILFSFGQIVSFDNMMKEEQSEPLILYPASKVEASEHPYKGTFIAKEPGVYQLTFDNSGSWFNSKKVMYDVFVLEPEIDLDSFNEQQQQRHQSKDKEAISTKGGKRASLVYEIQDMNETVVLIHLDKFHINFKVESSQKSYELQFAYPEIAPDWAESNQLMLETMNKIIERIDNKIQNSIIVKFIYSVESLLHNKMFVEEGVVKKEEIEANLTTIFSFLQTFKENIENVEISTDIEYMISEILWDNSYGSSDSLYVLCIDNRSKTFQGAYRTHDQQSAARDFNGICLPEIKEGKVQFEFINQLYFNEAVPEKKLNYLACLLVNICEFYHCDVKYITIFENKATEFLNENHSKIVEIFANLPNKKKEEIPKINFQKVRLQEILKF